MTTNKWPATLGAFRNLTEDDLVRLYDGEGAELGFHRREIVEELHRREIARYSGSVKEMTRWILVLTVVILVLTGVNVLLVWHSAGHTADTVEPTSVIRQQVQPAPTR